MVSKNAFGARFRLGVAVAAVTVFAALAVAVPGLAAPAVGTFQPRATSPHPLNNVAVDPTTNLIYAQQYEGKNFYRYDPSTNKWKKLVKSPIPQGNNGGAAYLNGKIYTVYTDNSTQMGVYNIRKGTWSIRTNPLGLGTSDITSAGGLLYLVDSFAFVSYNPATHTTHPLAAPPFPFSRWGDLVPYKGKLYGTEGDGSTGFGVYHIATNSWTTLPSVPAGAVLGAAIDPVKGAFYAYGTYGGTNFYRFGIKSDSWSTLTFPFHNISDGGMAYVSTPGLQGIYAVYGQNSHGFTRYVTPLRHHH